MRVLTKNKNPKVSRKELKEAAKFIYACLVSRKTFLETTLIIESKDLGSGLHGQVDVPKSEDHRNPKKFKIQINTRLSRKKQLQALAHEMVHVKQLIYNELGHTEIRKGQTFTKWKSRMVNETRRNYMDFPWEVEAFNREGALYKKYINHTLLFGY